MTRNIKDELGETDIYLIDQILKGRFDHCKKVLDAGCGYGRNLHYFLRNNYEVYGVDENAEAIHSVQQFAEEINPGYDAERFRVSTIEKMDFNDKSFDLIICSAVLHFAKDRSHFEDMLFSCWRTLKPGGYFFARLASNIGIENRVIPTSEGRYFLPDESERYLVDLETMLHYTNKLGGTLFEPIKTTNVQNLRCMSTLCIMK